jgi:hypothetical protein
MQARKPGRIRWLLSAVIVAVAVPLVAFGFQAGHCTDYAGALASKSVCTVGPAVGYPGAWALTGAAALVAIYAVRRAFASARK